MKLAMNKSEILSQLETEKKQLEKDYKSLDLQVIEAECKMLENEEYRTLKQLISERRGIKNDLRNISLRIIRVENNC